MQDLLRRMSAISTPTTSLATPSSVSPADSNLGNDIALLGAAEQSALFQALAPFESGYLGKSLSR